jgi:CubicO group peptidase (beta-lactamase class C family)
MKKLIFLFFIVSLFLIPRFQAEAQNVTASTTTTSTFDASAFPQWAKDMRRWDIITFGVFPFSMFTVTFITDIVRWNNANGFDFSETGRQYAPWPLKTAGGIEMTNDEYTRTILLALGLSMTVALVDLIIVKIKRHNALRRTENMPPGSYEIERRPYGEPQEPETSDGEE